MTTKKAAPKPSEIKEARSHLTKEEYFEWRTTIAELWLAEEKAKVTALTSKVMQRDAELLQAKVQVFNLTEGQSSQKSLKEARAEYDRYKAILESALGVSLNDKVIDGSTFEVKSI